MINDDLAGIVALASEQIISTALTELGFDGITTLKIAIAADGDSFMPRVRKVKYVTAGDGKVCLICDPLDGMVWDEGDPDIVHPPDDTHPNCRCYLVDADTGEILEGDLQT